MESQRWYRDYQSAVLELDPKKLRERIDAACTAIAERRLELQPPADYTAEHQMLTDAEQALEALRRNQFK